MRGSLSIRGFYCLMVGLLGSQIKRSNHQTIQQLNHQIINQ